MGSFPKGLANSANTEKGHRFLHKKIGKELYLWQGKLSPEDGKEEIDWGVSAIN